MIFKNSNGFSKLVRLERIFKISGKKFKFEVNSFWIINWILEVSNELFSKHNQRIYNFK